MDLMTYMQSADTPTIIKGLFTSAIGLCGVFLVLILFYFSIKLMQVFSKSE